MLLYNAEISECQSILYNGGIELFPNKGREVSAMTVEEVLGRVDELCAERGWSHYTLAKEAKMATSSVYNMFKRKTIPKVETLEKVCDGFQITLGEFFSPEDRRGDLTTDDRLLLEVVHRLPQAERRVLKAYADGLEKAAKKK